MIDLRPFAAPPPPEAPPPAPAAAVAAGPVDPVEAAPAAAEPPPPAAPAAMPGAQEPVPQVAALPRPPDPELLEPSSFGPLPKVGPSGREPWRVYARPFDSADPRPRIALVLGNLGLSGGLTESAIQDLPGAVTLAFSTEIRSEAQRWIDLARAAGHEVMLNLPMEPESYPSDDPGSRPLLTTLTATQNLERLRWNLGRFTGYVGVTDFMGSRFTASVESLRPILAEVAGRGLLFLDSRSAVRSMATEVAAQIGAPRASSDLFLDESASRGAIDARLEELERIARRQGYAVGMSVPNGPYPVTIERIAEWARGLEERGLVLVPVSAVARTGPGR